MSYLYYYLLADLSRLDYIHKRTSLGWDYKQGEIDLGGRKIFQYICVPTPLSSSKYILELDMEKLVS